jgi:hypothetical protein
MLKKKLISYLVATLSIIALACSTKKEEHNHHENQTVANADWKEMDDFHMIMADAFHPYKDSSNLEPAKNNASSLVAAADKWAQAPLPDKFQGDDEIKFKLNQLKVDASTFEEVVKSGDDKLIAQSLTKLHDLFHEIQESWYEEGE